MRIAIVGGGVTGLVAAHHLSRSHRIRLFEADDRLGGHAHTVDVDVDGARFPVDTGFIVCNERTYPRFTALLERLGVETVPSEMSLSVRDERAGVEWGTAPSRLRARPAGPGRVGARAHAAHAGLVARIPRWHRAGSRLLEEVDRGEADPDETLRSFLARAGLPPSFGEGYVVPLTAAVWSADPTTVLDFPAATICRFLRNHGMLTLGERPQWRTLAGGSRSYVDAISAPWADDVQLKSPVTELRRRPEGGVDVRVAGAEPEAFDAVVVAVHAPTALAMLPDADADERAVLGAVRTQPNPTVLHTDRSVLPRNEAVWSSWNVRLPEAPQEQVAVTYLMNRLQPLPTTAPVCVSLNQDDRIDPDAILGAYDYAHPVLDAAAIRDQRRLPRLQGRGGVYWAGAWASYGFHEDGTRAAEQVCERIDPGSTRW
ncbi:FAD-dependent oxidoreductase [Iamia majanohamensis]|uniref:FAD-dependent oxidoreductase n=1 Tax=Iamia majanohamensis TaxID=467976 RepID=A0AAE9Y834_9ACTN|nr:FAD-dependent oxidoreductase [Iamia majanohamensis]WCO66183.1 FAD-dependent oxidoreductase [Iamia majanohamensis]